MQARVWLLAEENVALQDLTPLGGLKKKSFDIGKQIGRKYSHE